MSSVNDSLSLTLFVFPGMLPLKVLLKNKKMRWSLAAHDICYTRELHSKFFALGQCIPVIRGDGVHQRGMNYCVELLNLGKWVKESIPTSVALNEWCMSLDEVRIRINSLIIFLLSRSTFTLKEKST